MLKLICATAVVGLFAGASTGAWAWRDYDGPYGAYDQAYGTPVYWDGYAPEGFHPAANPWGPSHGFYDTNAPGCPLKAC